MRHHWYASFLLLLHLVHKLFSTSSLEKRFEGKVANFKGMQLVDGKAGEGVGLDTSCSGGPPITTPRSYNPNHTMAIQTQDHMSSAWTRDHPRGSR